MCGNCRRMRIKDTQKRHLHGGWEGQGHAAVRYVALLVTTMYMGGEGRASFGFY